MNRTRKILALIIAAALLMLAFVSCNKVEDNTPTPEDSNVIEDGNQESASIVKIVVGGTTENVYSVDYSDIEITEGVLSVIKHLAAEGKLTYKADDTGYGAFLTEVGALKQDEASGTYIYLYTSVEKDFDTSAYATTKVWDGKTLTSAGVGISQMTVEDGAVIYIGTVSYGS